MLRYAVAAALLGGLAIGALRCSRQASEPRTPPKTTPLPSAERAVERPASVAAALPPRVTAPSSSHAVACDPARSAEAAQVREQVRSTFARLAVPPEKGSLYVDSGVPDAAVQRLRYALARIDDLMFLRLGLRSSPPDVYLYASAARLRAGVCVSPNTISYYDGAIHLAIDAHDDLLGSLKHEYVHHALFSHGLRRPVWFQEGVAMSIENERDGARVQPPTEQDWESWRPQVALLPVQAMVQTFPRSGSAETVEAFYGQAFAMTAFLRQLGENGTACDPQSLVRALSTGRVRPEQLFDWAVSECGSDLVSTARLPLWDDYVANGMKFNPGTASAIAMRSNSRSR